MSFINPNKDQLKNYKDLLKSEGLCYNDLDYVSILKIQPDDEQDIYAGYGLEVFDRDALLRSVVVTKAKRGDGAGKIIVKDALKAAKELGVSTMYLLTTTADKFFLRLGFKVIQRTSVPDAIGNTTEFKTFCPDTAVCMKYEI
jgi:amino-acid N-acetyltransferase